MQKEKLLFYSDLLLSAYNFRVFTILSRVAQKYLFLWNNKINLLFFLTVKNSNKMEHRKCYFTLKEL